MTPFERKTAAIRSLLGRDPPTLPVLSARYGTDAARFATVVTTSPSVRQLIAIKENT